MLDGPNSIHYHHSNRSYPDLLSSYISLRCSYNIPLHMDTLHSNRAALERMLANVGANPPTKVNTSNADSCTLLHLAAAQGKITMVKALIENSAFTNCQLHAVARRGGHGLHVHCVRVWLTQHFQSAQHTDAASRLSHASSP